MYIYLDFTWIKGMIRYDDWGIIGIGLCIGGILGCGTLFYCLFLCPFIGVYSRL